MGSKQSITVPGRYSEIRRICEFIAAGAEHAGFDSDAIFRLELCCDEAVTNIIEHAYEGEDGGDIVVSYDEDNENFTITLRDRGRPFDPNLVPPPPAIAIDETAADGISGQLRIGGLGLHLIRNLMDEVHFSSDPQEGNKLVMVKKITANNR